MTKFNTFAAALIVVSTQVLSIRISDSTAGIASAGSVGLGSVITAPDTTQEDNTEEYSNVVYIDVCNDCVIGQGNSTHPIHIPEWVNPMWYISEVPTMFTV